MPPSPPLTIQLNGEPRQVPSGATVADVLATLTVQSRFVAVEVNRELIPRADHARQQLSPGDQMEVVTLVGGG